MRRWPWRSIAATVVLSFVGAVSAVAIAGRVHAPIGPFDTTAVARPSLRGETVVRLAPLGTIRLDTHAGPIAVELRVEELRLAAATRIAEQPAVLDSLEDDVAADARHALLALAWRVGVVAILGAVAGSQLAGPSIRRAAGGAVLGAALVAAVGGTMAVTFDADAVAEPRYTGVLTVAPSAVGDVEAIANRVGEYRAQLVDLVTNAVNLFRAAEALPSLDTGDDAIRVLHVSDIHNNPQAFDLVDRLVPEFDIDAVVDTGDVTDWGTEPEARLLDRIGEVPVPYVFVRGNHDSRAVEAAVADQPNAVVLDGRAATVAGIRFWGIGDPRYTPRKDQPTGQGAERDAIDAFAPTVARRLRRSAPDDVDVLLIHDSRGAKGGAALVPLVLAGHTHKASETHIGRTPVLVEGSTGGAGLRGLQAAERQPLTCSVLYFDRATHRLLAYDRISVDGLGGASARIERHVVDQDRTTSR